MNAVQTKSELDLDFTTLWECLSVTDAERNPAASADSYGARCRQLGLASQQMAGLVCRKVMAECQAVLGELTSAAEWGSLTEKGRRGRFAQRVATHPAAALFFRAYAGHLDETWVCDVAKTPRRLRMLAESLGLHI